MPRRARRDHRRFAFAATPLGSRRRSRTSTRHRVPPGSDRANTYRSGDSYPPTLTRGGPRNGVRSVAIRVIRMPTLRSGAIRCQSRRLIRQLTVVFQRTRPRATYRNAVRRCIPSCAEYHRRPTTAGQAVLDNVDGPRQRARQLPHSAGTPESPRPVRLSSKTSNLDIRFPPEQCFPRLRKHSRCSRLLWNGRAPEAWRRPRHGSPETDENRPSEQ